MYYYITHNATRHLEGMGSGMGSGSGSMSDDDVSPSVFVTRRRMARRMGNSQQLLGAVVGETYTVSIIGENDIGNSTAATLTFSKKKDDTHTHVIIINFRMMHCALTNNHTHVNYEYRYILYCYDVALLANTLNCWCALIVNNFISFFLLALTYMPQPTTTSVGMTSTPTSTLMPSTSPTMDDDDDECK